MSHTGGPGGSEGGGTAAGMGTDTAARMTSAEAVGVQAAEWAAGQETVLVLDFGAQYSQLIARRVRENQVYCEILPHDTPASAIRARDPRGIILSGGPASVYGEGAPACDHEIFALGIPVLGICYGMQYLAAALGGEVQRAVHREYGRAELFVDDAGDLLAGVAADGDGSLVCWMSHGDRVVAPPPGFTVLAHTANSPVAAMADRERRLYGVQFHPEVVHTPFGDQVMRNFLFDVCGCRGSWTMASFVEEAIQVIREAVGAKRVVCGLSGGVDSATAAALVHRAVGEQLVSIFVDHGLMRKGEPEQVVETFTGQGMQLVHVDARERFLARLEGVTDPERKRKIIGEEFIRVFEEEARALGEIDYLVQGTLYPDVIESGPGAAALIKSHHNVGGLPEKMDLRLLEPLRQLFKDEVRELAQELELPADIVWRQPFPGPGLAVRVVGPVTAEKLEVVREADAVVREEIAKAGLEREVWQYFAVLSDTLTVGVMGDERTYAHLVGIRAVSSKDGMTADWARIPADVLERMASRIMNEVPRVNRVVYDISSKPPATIEWE